MENILIIDDRVTNRNVLSKLASSAEQDAVVHTFSDPREAIEWTSHHVPDLVVTDFKMPGMDGAEFTREFRTRPMCFDVPVMVVTIYEDRAYRYRALEAGATDFLLSPVDHHEFQARIRNFMRLRRQQKIIQRRTLSLERRLNDDMQSHRQALSETQNMLRQVIDAVPALISATDPSGRYLLVNSWFAAHHDMSIKDIVSRGREEILDASHAQRHAELDRGVLASGEGPPVYEEEFATQRGEPRTYLTVKSPVRAGDGRVTAIVNVSLDISDRKHAERALAHQRSHLRVILDNIPNFISASDRAHRFTLVNLALARAAGMSPDSLIGRRFSEVFGPGDRVSEDRVSEDRISDEDRADNETVFRTGNSVHVRERRFVDGQGREKWLELVKVPFVFASGETEVLTVATDITARRRAAVNLLRAKEAAEEANRAKTQFLAGMSHELRTPLNHIMGFAEIIAGEHLGPIGTERYGEYARDIHGSGAHLLSVIDDILDYSRLESGRAALDEREIDIGAIAGAAATEAIGRAEAGGLVLDVDIAAGLPRLLGDALMIRRIVDALLSNAIKFTPKGGHIALRVAAAGARGLVIEVEDSGIGMAAADIAVAMSPFRQVENVLNRRHSGAGLGLPLVERMAALHGGAFSLASEPDVGTIATVRLPAARILAARTAGRA